MGCNNSSTNPDKTTIKHTDAEFLIVLQQVQKTWPEIKKIDDLGAKTFAHLLKKYPEQKPIYHIPEAYKHEVDLLRAKEVKEAGDKFIELYSDIVKHSSDKLDETIREKAVKFNQQGIKPSQIKLYGESLVHVANFELGNQLNTDEKQSWRVFSSYVSTRLAIEMGKLPK